MIQKTTASGRILLPVLSGLALLTSVLALAWLWQIQSRQGANEAERTRAESEVVQLRARLTSLEQSMQGVDQRVADAQITHRALREEVLGIGERAGLLEDALKRLSERRIDSIGELHINQAELLLAAGVERLRLFRDPETALSAFELADAELARLNDARFATVRQTLKREIESLRSAPRQAEADVLNAIDTIANALPTLKTRAEMASLGTTDEPAPNWRTRIARVFSELIRIRKVDPKQAAWVGPLQADALRAVVGLDLLLAKEALTEGDLTRYQQSASRARNAVMEGFELHPAGDQPVFSALARMQAYAPVEWPKVGMALEQLERLRGTADLLEPEA
ncbi:hypothetical protein C7S18_01640 [Ahniella affigens]|uniref:Uroporphyrin-3 C-methyltransferase n=1 Tax=Ahniella affigens TaxID=2021234 RepID=A0A2P1PM99_9GAMM|nr:uroporphyrinogen-III C-methyltransferase [Ahniella affigens]AVP95973.1 hypothetical protein C7S18_01640 [Ahniella affigens]